MDIIQKIQLYCRAYLNLDIETECFEKEDISIGSLGIELDTIGIMYLIRFVENEFSIKFTREQLLSDELRTLKGLVSAIQSHIRVDELKEVD